MKRSPITCHGQSYNLIVVFFFFYWKSRSVLDSSTGKPAEGVTVKLQQLETSGHGVDVFRPLAEGFDPMITYWYEVDLCRAG